MDSERNVKYDSSPDCKRNQGQFPSSKSNLKKTEQPEIEVIDLADSNDDEPPVQPTKSVNIRSLLPGKKAKQLWLSDDVIFTVLTLRTAGTNYDVVDSTWFQSNNREDKNKQMKRHLENIKSSPEKKLVLAFCWENHWRLLVIDNTNIRCYDPKEPGITFEGIPKVLELSKDFNLQMVSMEHVGPQQAEEDTVNCGIFVVLTVETLCNERQWDYTDINEFRPEILEELDSNPNFVWTHPNANSQGIVKLITEARSSQIEPNSADEPKTVSDSICSVSTPSTVCEERAVTDLDTVDKPKIVSEPISFVSTPIRNNETSSPDTQDPRETMLLLAFFYNNADLLRDVEGSMKVNLYDLQAAARKIMIFLGVRTLNKLEELNENSVNHLEFRLKDFIKALDDVELPKNLLQSCKRFCSKYSKERSTINQPRMVTINNTVTKPRADSEPQILSKTNVIEEPSITHEPRIDNTPGIASHPSSSVSTPITVNELIIAVSKPEAVHEPKTVDKPETFDDPSCSVIDIKTSRTGRKFSELGAGSELARYVSEPCTDSKPEAVCSSSISVSALMTVSKPITADEPETINEPSCSVMNIERNRTDSRLSRQEAASEPTRSVSTTTSKPEAFCEPGSSWEPSTNKSGASSMPNAQSTPTDSQKEERAAILFLAFANNSKEMLKTKDTVSSASQSDLQFAAENLMLFLGVDTLDELRELTEGSVEDLRTDLESMLDGKELPTKHLLESVKKFCSKHWKESSSLVQPSTTSELDSMPVTNDVGMSINDILSWEGEDADKDEPRNKRRRAIV